MPYWTGQGASPSFWRRLILPPSGMDQWFIRILTGLLIITFASTILALQTALSLREQVTADTSARQSYERAAQQRGCLILVELSKRPDSYISRDDLKAAGC